MDFKDYVDRRINIQAALLADVMAVFVKLHPEHKPYILYLMAQADILEKDLKTFLETEQAVWEASLLKELLPKTAVN